MPPLTPDHLTVLVCPVCRHTLALEPQTVLCTQCHRRYPIIDGIPVLLPGRAS